MDRDNRDKRKHNPDAEGTTPAQRITARFGLTRGRHFCALLSHTNSIPDTNQVPCSNLTSTRNRYPRGDGEVVCVFCTADMDTTSTLRSEERRVGKECVSTGKSRWARVHKK